MVTMLGGCVIPGAPRTSAAPCPDLVGGAQLPAKASEVRVMALYPTVTSTPWPGALSLGMALSACRRENRPKGEKLSASGDVGVS